MSSGWKSGRWRCKRLEARRHPPPSHRNIKTASPLITPFSWMMPSAFRSAFVLNWRNVSVPLVNQLIWPGAVNAAVLMKSKFWSSG